MAELAKGPQGLRAGRGARERLIAAAIVEFRARGVTATSMDQVCAAAQVSKRTTYQHFGTKTDLVTAALHAQDLDEQPGQFVRPDLAPRDQLLAVFDDSDGPMTLCPFVGAAVESPETDGPVRRTARDYKRTVAARLATIASEAGAPDPEGLGEQLALLLDGASVRTHVTGDDALATARVIATALVGAAVPRASVRPTRRHR